MTSEDFQTLRRAFENLVAASEEERTRLIEGISEQDPALAEELRRMLAAFGNRNSLLDRTETVPLAPESFQGRSASLHPGSVLGAYVLDREIGRGGMGVVYQGRRADGTFKKQVAIKILRHDRVDSQFLRRFHQERQILAQLDHPHIASILDGGETSDGAPYFVMEYVDGVPLTTYCETHGLTVDQKLDLFLQVCDAVQHAHRNLTVHRDLKPSNILVTDAGAVKLLDFGIAKLLQPETDDRSFEATAAILTPEYCSPEQIRRTPITTATDVFSLGILLYQMLSGVHPFSAKGALAHEVMRAICEDDPVPMSQAAARGSRQLRGELDAIVSTALRKQPTWRYPSVEQLADDIARFRRGWPVQAKGDGVGYRLRKFVRRQWLPLAAALLILLLLTAGIFATSHQARLAEQARAVADRARIEAEQQRELADRQRSLAENAQHSATEQRALAEARSKEAESERRKEQDRYRDVRSLASSMLFDLHDGIRDLAGSTTARRLVVAKAQRQLE
ncbi:MAG TPA: protein kinase, partial [Bryobacteraceae bacterium]|nr:protein kinase [Bryobacteraceae bacterium]